MDSNTRTCKICSKTYVRYNIIMFYYHMNQHINHNRDLFSKDEIDAITKACNNRQLSYLGIKGKNICKICKYKAPAKNTLISHMKLHLNTHESSFSEEEIQIIKETHAYVRKVKLRSYKKIMNIFDIDMVNDDIEEAQAAPAAPAAQAAPAAPAAPAAQAAQTSNASDVAAPTANTQDIIHLAPLINSKFGIGTSQKYYL